INSPPHDVVKGEGVGSGGNGWPSIRRENERAALHGDSRQAPRGDARGARRGAPAWRGGAEPARGQVLEVLGRCQLGIYVLPRGGAEQGGRVRGALRGGQDRAQRDLRGGRGD